MARWVQEDYPKVKDTIYECTQYPGDIVYDPVLTCFSAGLIYHATNLFAAVSYVPGYYDHAVLNLKDSFGVAMQVCGFLY